jgi:hypothetical protein
MSGSEELSEGGARYDATSTVLYKRAHSSQTFFARSELSPRMDVVGVKETMWMYMFRSSINEQSDMV